MTADQQAELAAAMGFSIDDVLEHVIDSGRQQAQPSAPEYEK